MEVQKPCKQSGLGQYAFLVRTSSLANLLAYQRFLI